MNEGFAPMAIEKKSKFWSYQLNSSANLAHLVHFRGKWAGLAVLSSEIWAPAFFKHNNSYVATVNRRPTFVNMYISFSN